MASKTDFLRRLKEGNETFQRDVSPSTLAALAEGQRPWIMFISCSDSRVVPERIFALDIGEAFVIRVAGNTAADRSLLGTIEIALSHLRIRAIVILGHTDCGAIKLAVAGDYSGNVASVASDIRDAIARMPAEQARNLDAVSEANVKRQVKVLADRSPMIADAVRKGELMILGAMYDLNTGAVRFI